MAIKLQASQRESLSSSETKGLRNKGQVPAVVYGKEKETLSIAVSSIDLLKTLRDEGRNAIIDLDVDGAKTVSVMLQDYQMDPVKDSLVHVDFYIVDLDEAREVSVQVVVEGEPVGTKEGGVLQQPLFEVLLSVKPGDIPDSINIDVSELAIGDSISIADLPESGKYEFLEDEDAVIVTVVPPAAEEPETTDEDAPAEPELVGKKDEDQE
ncbi:50S ribosomal protein L25/general stress protein Ctc [Oceanobacillus sp. CAU 1775]